MLYLDIHREIVKAKAQFKDNILAYLQKQSPEGVM